jgi:hypothetical protein
MRAFPMKAGEGRIASSGATPSAPGFLSRRARGSRPAQGSRQAGPRADGSIEKMRTKLEAFQWAGLWTAQAAQRPADRL